MSNRIGTLYIISAPSGGGKTSLINALLQNDPHIIFSVSYTTRAQRPGEVEGVDYHFIDKKKFETLITAGEFLEHACVFGNYYGTSKQWVHDKLVAGTDIVLEIDWQGAQQIRQLMPLSVSVFILPPSKEVLYARLCDRARDEQSTIDARMQQASNEISHCQEYDYLIVNENFGKALADLQSIFHAQRLKQDVQSQRYESLLSCLLTQ
ncbi:MAG: guanylate kinase [Gammaproteobacteria bacterium]